MRKLVIALTAATALLSLSAHAVPWCHGGTIVHIQTANWTGPQILANFYGAVPAGVADPEVYKAFTATSNYASTFSGGGGGFGGYSVPGSGTVRVTQTGPYTLTNMVGPGYYYVNQGVQFKLHKCYTIPPLVGVKEVVRMSPDSPGSNTPFEPLPEVEAVKQYWSVAEKEVLELKK